MRDQAQREQDAASLVVVRRPIARGHRTAIWGGIWGGYDVPQGSREEIELRRLLADLALQFGDARGFRLCDGTDRPFPGAARRPRWPSRTARGRSPAAEARGLPGARNASGPPTVE